MATLTQKIISGASIADRDAALLAGFADGHSGKSDTRTPNLIATFRALFGFKNVSADLLTPPDANAKLDKGRVPSYGLTLAHATLTEWNACPWAGDCTAVCVLNNGNGRYNSVQRAWQWRTTFLAEQPIDALYRIGWELGRAVRKNGEILFRPNVNSDVLWHKIAPSLGNLPGITVYGYSKNPAVLHTNGLIDGMRIAYSWNENSSADRVRAFLAAGGTVAIVTDRKPGAAIDADAVRRFLGITTDIPVVDADKTDEWMLAPGTIGDLSAKGSARDLIGRSGFVASAYGAPVRRALVLTAA